MTILTQQIENCELISELTAKIINGTNRNILESDLEYATSLHQTAEEKFLYTNEIISERLISIGAGQGCLLATIMVAVPVFLNYKEQFYKEQGKDVGWELELNRIGRSLRTFNRWKEIYNNRQFIDDNNYWNRSVYFICNKINETKKGNVVTDLDVKQQSIDEMKTEMDNTKNINRKQIAVGSTIKDLEDELIKVRKELMEAKNTIAKQAAIIAEVDEEKAAKVIKQKEKRDSEITSLHKEMERALYQINKLKTNSDFPKKTTKELIEHHTDHFNNCRGVLLMYGIETKTEYM